jgi:hypothetical protein
VDRGGERDRGGDDGQAGGDAEDDVAEAANADVLALQRRIRRPDGDDDAAPLLLGQPGRLRPVGFLDAPKNVVSINPAQVAGGKLFVDDGDEIRQHGLDLPQRREPDYQAGGGVGVRDNPVDPAAGPAGAAAVRRFDRLLGHPQVLASVLRECSRVLVLVPGQAGHQIRERAKFADPCQRPLSPGPAPAINLL